MDWTLEVVSPGQRDVPQASLQRQTQWDGGVNPYRVTTSSSQSGVPYVRPYFFARSANSGDSCRAAPACSAPELDVSNSPSSRK